MTFFRVCGAVAASAILACAQGDGKTADQVYKNIIELKGTPADELIPAMQFISASLGVECSFCHVQGKFDADDKRPKKTARDMMAMTAAINKDAFKGRQEITCNTCESRPPNGTIAGSDIEHRFR